MRGSWAFKQDHKQKKQNTAPRTNQSLATTHHPLRTCTERKCGYFMRLHYVAKHLICTTINSLFPVHSNLRLLEPPNPPTRRLAKPNQLTSQRVVPLTKTAPNEHRKKYPQDQRNTCESQKAQYNANTMETGSAGKLRSVAQRSELGAWSCMSQRRIGGYRMHRFTART